MIGADQDAPASVCSRAGCHAPATAQIVWRNPRIHTPDRRKIWLACDEHTAFLHDYLAARDFPVAVEPFPASAEPAAGESS
jgi:hypothetical protein